MSDGFVIDMTNEVNRQGVRLATCVSALRLEVRTGMKMSRGVSVLAVANEIMGTNHRRKATALEALEAFHEAFKQEHGIGQP